MALSSPESLVPPRRVVINRTENPSEEQRSSTRWRTALWQKVEGLYSWLGFLLCSKVSLRCVTNGGNLFNLDNLLKF